jgi:hypothetical protein
LDDNDFRHDLSPWAGILMPAEKFSGTSILAQLLQIVTSNAG